MFLLAAILWSAGLFAVLRAPVVERALVVPLTAAQQRAAEHYAGSPTAPIAVTLECSGTDVLALCLAAILACPVAWRLRIAGALGAFAFVMALNTVRIATLGLAAASPAVFDALHLQVWPAILLVASGGYVLGWMRFAVGSGHRGATAPDGTVQDLARRFAPRAAVVLVAFALCGPWIAESEALVAAGGVVAGAAGAILASAGLAATAAGNVLTTTRGAFVVTPECLATALVPVYIAGVLTARRSAGWRAAALAAAIPLFGALAVVRLLLLAIPPAIADSPLILVHGFHQLVLGVVAVALLAFWREPLGPNRTARAARRTGLAIGAGVAAAVVAGGPLTAFVLAVARAVASLGSHTLADLTNPGDAQGALAVLPAYQACLLLALGIAARLGWRRVLPALVVLLVSQVLFLVALGEVADHAGLVAHALLLRGWAVAAPALLTLSMIRSAPPATGTLLPLRPAADGPR
jgi:exosortase/archaeosortase family protein